MAKARGGYTKNKVHELTLRADSELFQRLQAICEAKNEAMALVLRTLLCKALEQQRAEVA
jgi:predicted transcriptional regulator